MVSRMAPTTLAGMTVHDWGGPEGAPALLLLHGLTDSGECWADAVPRWTPRYRVLSWDARGHGSSPRFTADQLEAGVAETMRDDAVAVLQALAEAGLARPLLVGHSMGGGTAAAVACTRPDLVTAVVLEDPALGEDPDESAEERLAAGEQRLADAQRWHDDPQGALAQGRAEHPGWPEAEYAGWARAKTRTDLRMLATGQVRLRRPWPQVAAELAAPALLLTCDDPLLWDEESRQRLRAVGSPQLRVEHLAGAGHCIRRDRPEAFHAIVDPWLEAWATRAA